MAKDLSRFQGTPCHNCGAILEGRYCAECGQRATDLKQTFFGLLAEYLEYGLSLDTNFARSVTSLLRRPGHLTVEYLEGRRARYFSPLRVYLLMSVLFFWSLSLVSHQGIVNADGSPADLSGLEADVVEDVVGGAAATDTTAVAGPEAIEDEGFWARFGGRLEQGAMKVAEDPDDYVRALFSTISKLMFVLVPIFALLARLLNIRHKRPYLHFLVYGLHVHALIFMVGTIFNLVTRVHEPLQDWLQLAGVLGIPVYVALAMRTVFGGSKRKAFLKTFLLMPAYGMALGVGIMLVAVLQLLLI